MIIFLGLLAVMDRIDKYIRTNFLFILNFFFLQDHNLEEQDTDDEEEEEIEISEQQHNQISDEDDEEDEEDYHDYRAGDFINSTTGYLILKCSK